MRAKAIFKQSLKFLKLSLLAFVLFIFFYWGMAFVSSRISVNKSIHSDTSISIYILSNGVHTDIVLPINDKHHTFNWQNFVKVEHTLSRDTDFNFVAFGWGDRGFYLETPQWADLKTSVAFNAVFGLGRSAMHVTFYKQLRESESCLKTPLPHSNYLKLVQFIKDKFVQSPIGLPKMIPTHANYGKTDAFYEAHGRYNLFYTCNTWTNEALKSCDQKASLWTPFADGVLRHHR